MKTNVETSYHMTHQNHFWIYRQWTSQPNTEILTYVGLVLFSLHKSKQMKSTEVFVNNQMDSKIVLHLHNKIISTSKEKIKSAGKYQWEKYMKEVTQALKDRYHTSFSYADLQVQTLMVEFSLSELSIVTRCQNQDLCNVAGRERPEASQGASKLHEMPNKKEAILPGRGGAVKWKSGYEELRKLRVVQMVNQK